MFRKKWLVILLVVLLTFITTQIAFAYILDDLGDIQNTQSYLNGGWYSRPGLDSFPDPAGTYGPYPVQAQLAAGSTITTVNLNHGPPGGGSWTLEAMTINAGQISGAISEINPADFGFHYCQPHWDYAFFLDGYDSDGNFVENDERHVTTDPAIAGDPYVFQIENQYLNQPPVSNPNGPYEVDRWDPITLDGTGSFDLEGSGLTYAWDIYVTWPDYEGNPYYEYDDNFVDGSGPTPEFAFEENGEYHVRLKVTDECGEEDISETTIMVYDPHMVVIPQHNNIVGINWRPGLMLTLKIDEVIYDTVAVGPMGEKDGFGYHFNMDEYDVVVVPGMEVVLYGDYDTAVIGDEIVRPHTVRDFTIEIVDPETDTVDGHAWDGTYVRVRIDDPYWVEIVADADEISGYWLANFLDEFNGEVDITPETFINVLQQNDFDSSHTLRFWGEEPEPGPEAFFTIEPEHKWAHGEFWPVGVPITLTIDDDTDPDNGFIYQDIQESYPFEDDPERGAVDFDLQGVEKLERGLYVTMTDGMITKDTWIAELYYDYLDVGLDIAEGQGPGGNYGFMVASYTDDFFMELPDTPPGGWTANFGSIYDATNVPDTFILRWDEDGDETMIHLPEPLFIEGAVPIEPIEIGTSVPVWATFESSLFDGPADPLLDISFCIAAPDECFGPSGPTPNWLPAASLTDDEDVEYSYTTGALEVVFDQPGVYPAFVHAFNPDGPDRFAFLGLIVIYDPAGGFVTGGGWIMSPEGAYEADPSLTGKATFGFVSKYKKGAKVPTGNTEFQFHAGDLNFHSSQYDWLVVTGSDYARFKGTGTINGEGEYKFMIWAGDDDPDTFRIKIWEEVDDVEIVIYDNGMDQPIEGGNIVVHTKKK